jgi:hypothetical protein
MDTVSEPVLHLKMGHGFNKARYRTFISDGSKGTPLLFRSNLPIIAYTDVKVISSF